MNQEASISINKIRSFTDLKAWQESHRLVLDIYAITKKFPEEERFGLTSQVRRAVVSVTSNIAEGFGRGSYKEKNRFYVMALGSLYETQNHLFIARDIGYINQEEFGKIGSGAVTVSKIINGLIRSSQNLTHTS